MPQITVNGKTTFDIAQSENEIVLNGNACTPDISRQSTGELSMLLHNKSYNISAEKIDREQKEMVLRVNGRRYVLNLRDDVDLMLEKMGINMKATQSAAPLKAPMPGMILKILVQEGQTVNKGDGLLILEAMKMENVLKAATTCTVKAIKVTEKTAVEKGAVLIEMS